MGLLDYFRKGRRPQPSNDPYTTVPQNMGSGTPVTSFGYGPLVSKIDESFFGNGVFERGLEDFPWSGIAEYGDIFPAGMGGGSRPHPRHHRHREWNTGYGVTEGGVQPGPVGSGGIGSHSARFAGEAPPAGGEGYQNGGQSTLPGQMPSFDSQMGWNSGGGVPYPQRSTMGAPLKTYLTQHGDSFDRIADKHWGPGMSGTTIHQANPGLTGNSQDEIAPGHMINVPSAPPLGPVPGGVAGNGVGPGANQSPTRSRQHGPGMFSANVQADASLSAGQGKGRPAPGTGGSTNRGGRGIQKGRRT